MDRVKGRQQVINHRGSIRQPSWSRFRCTARCCRGNSNSNSLGHLLLHNNQALIRKFISSRCQPLLPSFPRHLATRIHVFPRNQLSQRQTRVNTCWWRCHQCQEGEVEEITPCSRFIPTSLCSYRIRHSLIDYLRIRDSPAWWEVWRGPDRCTKLHRGSSRIFQPSSNNCSLGSCWANKIIIRIWLFRGTRQSSTNIIARQLHSMEAPWLVPTLLVWESVHIQSLKKCLWGLSYRA